MLGFYNLVKGVFYKLFSVVIALLMSFTNLVNSAFIGDVYEWESNSKVVGSVDEAIEHINKYSTGHSEAIVTENMKNADEFLNRIDQVADGENRSRSELIREALRTYIYKQKIKESTTSNKNAELLESLLE